MADDDTPLFDEGAVYKNDEGWEGFHTTSGKLDGVLRYTCAGKYVKELSCKRGYSYGLYIFWGSAPNRLDV